MSLGGIILTTAFGIASGFLILKSLRKPAEHSFNEHSDFNEPVRGNARDTGGESLLRNGLVAPSHSKAGRSLTGGFVKAATGNCGHSFGCSESRHGGEGE